MSAGSGNPSFPVRGPGLSLHAAQILPGQAHCPVSPGDTLVMRVELTKFNKRFGVAKMDAKGYVGEELVVEAQLTLVMASSS